MEGVRNNFFVVQCLAKKMYILPSASVAGNCHRMPKSAFCMCKVAAYLKVLLPQTCSNPFYNSEKLFTPSDELITNFNPKME